MEGAFLDIYWAARGGESQDSAQKEWSSWQVAPGMSPNHQVPSCIKEELCPVLIQLFRLMYFPK